MRARTKNNSNELKKPSLIEILIEYLSTTSPVMLLMHLVYIMAVCATLSVSYVLAFHWSTVVQIYSEAHDVKGFSTNLRNSVEVDNKLNTILTDMLAKTGGIRTYIYRYHNGLAAISGVPFFFQTNTHEVISPGTSRLMRYEQRIPASFNIAINNQYVKNECAAIINADDDKDSQNYYYFQSRGAKAFVRCPIYMANGDLFGFIGVDFPANPTDMKPELAVVSEAARASGQIYSSINSSIKK